MDPTLPVFTKDLVYQIMDHVVSDTSYKPVQTLRTDFGLSLKPAMDDEVAAWEQIFATVNEQQEDSFEQHHLQYSKTPWFFGMQIVDTTNIVCGSITFYIAYSSWNGKILHLDQIHCSKLDERINIEQTILQILAQMAVKLGCARLTWTHKVTPHWHSMGDNPPEMHPEVLTLCMNRASMRLFVQDFFGNTDDGTTESMPFTNVNVNAMIINILEKVNLSNRATAFRLRLSNESDTHVMLKLVQGLAEYVKEPDAVLLDGTDYKKDGFSEPALFYCLIIDSINQNEEWFPCGFAFFFFGYQLGKGPFLYLEDLFIESKYRHSGGGSLAMATLSRISQSLSLSNFYWQALDWNTGALAFYEKIGAEVIDGLKTSRFAAHPSSTLQMFADSSTTDV